MKNIFLVVLAASWFLPILTLTLPNHHQLKWQEDIDKLETRALIDNDFESGSTSPWFDESPTNVKWRVEDFSSPLEVDSPAPKPATGTSYLRATRNADLSAGLAVFSSPVFTANPGDKVTFDFWIRSRRTGGNNLELVWLVGNNETILSSLSQYSTATNYEWRPESVEIPVSASTSGKLTFYGYCGSSSEDAVAIDNIVVESSSTTTPATGSSTEGTFTSTTSVTTVTDRISTTSSGTSTTGGTRPTPLPQSCNPCGGNYSDVGAISSPNYPNDYCNYLTCNYRITVPVGSRVELVFYDFVTEYGSDNVKIYNGLSTSDPLITTLSGDNLLLPQSINSTSNQLLIEFTTDYSNTFTGWLVEYSYF